MEQVRRRAMAGELPRREDVLRLLAYAPHSPQAAFLGRIARGVAREVAGDTARVWAAVGVDCAPCPMNCSRNFGCRVLGIDPSEARRKLANQCRIPETGSPEEFAGIRNEFDLVIDTVSAPSTLSAAGQALKNGGLCSMVGILKPGTLDCPAFLNLAWQRGIRFLSGWEMLHPMFLTERNLLRGINWISDGRYELQPLLTGILRPDLKEIGAAYRNLAGDPAHHIKLLDKSKSSPILS